MTVGHTVAADLLTSEPELQYLDVTQAFFVRKFLRNRHRTQEPTLMDSDPMSGTGHAFSGMEEEETAKVPFSNYVADLSGIFLTVLTANLNCFSSWILFMGSNRSAWVGHTFTQAGRSPASTLSAQRLHFCIFSSVS
jgi:hypothetical protein